MAGKRIPLEQSFWNRVQKEDGCWIWKGWRTPLGYGVLQKGDNVKRLAHRLSWEIHFGAIPKGLCVCHHCDNPPCVRPDHLFLGTQKQNIQDAVRKNRMHPGELHGNSKLTWDSVREIRRAYAAKEGTLATLAERFGVTFGRIGAIVRNESWIASREFSNPMPTG